MEHKAYPKWKYKHAEAPKMVDSAEAEAALGEGWHDSPAHVKAPDAEPPEAPPFEDYEASSQTKSKRAHR